MPGIESGAFNALNPTADINTVAGLQMQYAAVA